MGFLFPQPREDELCGVGFPEIFPTWTILAPMVTKSTFSVVF